LLPAAAAGQVVSLVPSISALATMSRQIRARSDYARLSPNRHAPYRSEGREPRTVAAGLLLADSCRRGRPRQRTLV